MSKPALNSADLRALAKWAGAQGWRWRHCGSGHLRWNHDDVPHPVFTAGSPRSNGTVEERAKLNRALRRAREGRAG